MSQFATVKTILVFPVVVVLFLLALSPTTLLSVRRSLGFSRLAHIGFGVFIEQVQRRLSVLWVQIFALGVIITEIHLALVVLRSALTEEHIREVLFLGCLSDLVLLSFCQLGKFHVHFWISCFSLKV